MVRFRCEMVMETVLSGASAAAGLDRDKGMVQG